eukprot:366095-Chlamydomonas_euryale.AAC.19
MAAKWRGRRGANHRGGRFYERRAAGSFQGGIRVSWLPGGFQQSWGSQQRCSHGVNRPFVFQQPRGTPAEQPTQRLETLVPFARCSAAEVAPRKNHCSRGTYGPPAPVQSGLENCFRPLCLPFLSAPGGR